HVPLGRGPAAAVRAAEHGGEVELEAGREGGQAGDGDGRGIGARHQELDGHDAAERGVRLHPRGTGRFGRLRFGPPWYLLEEAHTPSCHAVAVPGVSQESRRASKAAGMSACLSYSHCTCRPSMSATSTWATIAGSRSARTVPSRWPARIHSANVSRTDSYRFVKNSCAGCAGAVASADSRVNSATMP